MVNAKTRKACEKNMTAQMTAQIPRAGVKLPGGLTFTKNARNKTMKHMEPIMKNARKMCGMTPKQQKKAAKKLFSKMLNSL